MVFSENEIVASGKLAADCQLLGCLRRFVFTASVAVPRLTPQS